MKGRLWLGLLVLFVGGLWGCWLGGPRAKRIVYRRGLDGSKREVPLVVFTGKEAKADKGGGGMSPAIKDAFERIKKAFNGPSHDLKAAEREFRKALSMHGEEPGAKELAAAYLSTLIILRWNLEYLNRDFDKSAYAEDGGASKGRVLTGDSLREAFPWIDIARKTKAETLAAIGKAIGDLRKKGDALSAELRKRFPVPDINLIIVLAAQNGKMCFFVPEDYENVRLFEERDQFGKKVSRKMPIFRTGSEAHVNIAGYTMEQGESGVEKHLKVRVTLYRVKTPEKALLSRCPLPSPEDEVVKAWSVSLTPDFPLDADAWRGDVSRISMVEWSGIPITVQECFLCEEAEQVPLPVDGPGLYIVKAEAGGVALYTPVLVSDLDLMVKYDGRTLVAFADADRVKDKKDGRIAFSVFGNGGELFRGFGDADGLFAAGTEGTPKNAYVAARIGPHCAFAEIAPAPEPKIAQVNAYFITDRGVYRPGDDVHVKIVAREYDPATYTYTTPYKGDVVVSVKDPRGRVLSRRSLVANDFGTVSFDVPSDKEALLGTYTILAEFAGKQFTSRFKVLEYRKPECEVKVLVENSSLVVGEDARVKVRAYYYHGQPLAGREAVVSFGDKMESRIRLDERGEGTVAFPTAGETPSYEYCVAEVTDITGRVFRGEATIQLYPSAVKVSVDPPKRHLRKGDVLKLKIRLKDLSDHPVKGGEVVLNVERRKEKSECEVWVFEEVLRTDGKGVASYSLNLTKPGKYHITVAAKDSKGRKALDKAKVFVTSAANEAPKPVDYHRKPLSLVMDDKNKAPGDMVEVSASNLREKRRALLTFDTTRILSYGIVSPSHSSARLPSNPRLSWVWANALCFSGEDKLEDGSRFVELNGNDLRVDVSTPKEKYSPGDEVPISVASRDNKGNKVDAEVALSVVDKAVLDMGPSRSEIARRLFKGRYLHHTIPANIGINVDYLVAARAMVLGRYGGLRCYGGSMCVRRDFRDTAFWGACLAAPDGDWSGKIKLPDDLTAWVARAVVVGRDGRAGEGRCEFKSAKDFMTRVITPRTLASGDSAMILVSLENVSNTAKSCVVRFLAKGCKLAPGEKAVKRVEVPAKSSVVLGWKVKSDKAGAASFAVFADAGNGTGDAEERVVPIESPSIKNVTLKGGCFNGGASFDFVLPDDADRTSVKFSLDVAAMPAVTSVCSAVDYLVAYPHGCAEQTMSRFMPALRALGALRAAGMENAPLRKKIDRYVGIGLGKLYGYQHDDGGWGWWKNDHTKPYLTAYVVYGLSVTKESGYAVDERVVKRGLECLSKLIDAEKSTALKAFMVMAYSQWGKPNEKWLADLHGRRSKLGSFALGELLMACVNAHDPARSRDVLAAVVKRAKRGPSGVCWPSDDGTRLTSGQLQATAVALKSIIAVDPDNKLIPGAVGYILNAGKGGRWGSTKDSAAAVDALSAYLVARGKRAPNRQVRGTVRVNGGVEIPFVVEDVFPYRVSLPSKELSRGLRVGKNIVEIKADGGADLAYSAILRFESRKAALKPADNGLAVRREYFPLTAHGMPITKKAPLKYGASVSVGDIMRVETTVDSSMAQPAVYAMVRVPFPAGCEVVGWDKKQASHVEIHDSEVLFFLDKIPSKGVVLSFDVRAETPGVFHAAPATAELMYKPGINGYSAMSKLAIKGKVGKNGVSP